MARTQEAVKTPVTRFRAKDPNRLTYINAKMPLTTAMQFWITNHHNIRESTRAYYLLNCKLFNAYLESLTAGPGLVRLSDMTDDSVNNFIQLSQDKCQRLVRPCGTDHP